MPAIITDQYRILNAETFVDSFVGIGESGNNNFYTFLGHPNPQNTEIPNYGSTNWPSLVPDPVDSFSQEDFYYGSMLFLKKVTSNDVRRVIPRKNWQTGTVYEMYRNNYSAKNDYTPPNLTPNSKSTSLYDSNYYVINSEFRVYICINNGSGPDNPTGQKSTAEPTHISNAPQSAGNGSDGYLWKYLYTISPVDIVKFVTTKYIPLPQVWGDTSTASVKDAAVEGEIQTVVVTNGGSGVQVNASSEVDDSISGIKLVGDGDGGTITVRVSKGEVKNVESVVGGTGYTYASVKWVNGTYDGDKELNVGSDVNFEVIIPPKGGHGADIYRELGGFRVMLYSKFDNNIDDAPDYVIGNDFSRVGLVRNPLQFSGTGLLNNTTATNLSALKLKPAEGSSLSLSDVTYPTNGLITQTVGLGSTAVGYVASWDSTTGVLKYYQPVGFSTLSTYSYKQLDFDSSSVNTTINSDALSESLVVDTTFNGDSAVIATGKNQSLGQTFVNGKANPDVKKYSGDIIYVDNRAPITRTDSQKEEVKIVIEF